MGPAVALREKIELSLASRIPAALSPRPNQSPELVPTGIAELDTLLNNGLPLGSLTEIIGPDCSGRSTLVASILAGATKHGASCAYVDAADAFDPFSGAAIGINLAHLLWIRVGRTEEAAIHKGIEPSANIPGCANTSSLSEEVHCGGTGRHPRTEIHGMDIAVAKLFCDQKSLLRDKPIGNSKTANRKLTEPFDYTPRCSESIRGRQIEQVSVDRQPARRGEVVLHNGIAVPIQFARSLQYSSPISASKNSFSKKIWTSLDRALRATDMLLNTGGFRVIVLDVGNFRPEQVRRIPLASWHRYRLQAEKSQVLFLLLAKTICANGCASVVLRCKEAKEQWQSATENEDGCSLLTGFQYSITAERKRAFCEEAFSFGRKPVSSVDALWKRSTPGMR
jgi:recombination protein RecA